MGKALQLTNHGDPMPVEFVHMNPSRSHDRTASLTGAFVDDLEGMNHLCLFDIRLQHRTFRHVIVILEKKYHARLPAIPSTLLS